MEMEASEKSANIISSCVCFDAGRIHRRLSPRSRTEEFLSVWEIGCVQMVLVSCTAIRGTGFQQVLMHTELKKHPSAPCLKYTA